MLVVTAAPERAFELLLLSLLSSIIADSYSHRVAAFRGRKINIALASIGGAIAREAALAPRLLGFEISKTGGCRPRPTRFVVPF